MNCKTPWAFCSHFVEFPDLWHALMTMSVVWSRETSFIPVLNSQDPLKASQKFCCLIFCSKIWNILHDVLNGHHFYKQHFNGMCVGTIEMYWGKCGCTLVVET